MEELEVPSEYMLAISLIYNKVICCVRIGDTLSKKLNSTIVLSKNAHSHKLYLVYALMNGKKWLPSLFKKKTLRKFPLGIRHRAFVIWRLCSVFCKYFRRKNTKLVLKQRLCLKSQNKDK